MATIENYLPATPPLALSPEARRFLEEELSRVADIINSGSFCLPVLSEPPAKPEDGVIAYADGSNWNPGSGLGFYGYENGSWVKL